MRSSSARFRGGTFQDASGRIIILTRMKFARNEIVHPAAGSKRPLSKARSIDGG
jgi:hypothetical protein